MASRIFSSGHRVLRRQRRRQFWFQMASIFVLLASIFGLGIFAWWSGGQIAYLEVVHLEEANADISQKLYQARTDAQRLLMELEEARKAHEEILRRYEKEVPSGRDADLFALLKQRLQHGVTVDRLTQALTNTFNLQRCNGTPQRRRVALQLLSTQEPDHAVFLGGLIEVLITIPATDANMRDASVIVRTSWNDHPVRLSGIPVRQDFIINNLSINLEVKPAAIPGYAAIEMATCGPSR